MSKIALTLALTFTTGLVATGSGCYLVIDHSNTPPTQACAGPCGNDPGLTGTDTASGSYSTTVIGSGGVSGAGGLASGPDGPLTHVVTPPATCPSLPIDRFSELIVVDPTVTNDSRAGNQSSYRPWSFRQRLEALAPDSPEAAGALATAWLDQWTSLTSVPASADVGATMIPLQPRPGADQTLLCPWLQSSAGNSCDFSCTTCVSRRVDLAQAPFKLLAIVNRVDAAVSGSSPGAAACGTSGGELRFVYGAADPHTMDVLPFTVVFEYDVTLRPGETLQDWAAAWHALRKLGVGSPAFNAQLDIVVAQGLARGSLARVRTNEVAFGTADGDPWEMRQFVPQVTDAGTVRLAEVAMTGTPRLSLASSAELGQWIDANSASVLAGQNPLPASMLAASAPLPAADFSWHTKASDAATAAAFNQNTCNGCHGGRTDPGDIPFQQVAPPASLTNYGFGVGAPSAAQLSHFLHNPGHADELGRRGSVMAGLVCAACTATGGAGGYGGAAGAAGAGAQATGAGGAAGLGGAGGGAAGGAAGASGTGGYLAD